MLKLSPKLNYDRNISNCSGMLINLLFLNSKICILNIKLITFKISKNYIKNLNLIHDLKRIVEVIIYRKTLCLSFIK